MFTFEIAKSKDYHGKVITSGKACIPRPRLANGIPGFIHFAGSHYYYIIRDGREERERSGRVGKRRKIPCRRVKFVDVVTIRFNSLVLYQVEIKRVDLVDIQRSTVRREYS